MAFACTVTARPARPLRAGRPSPAALAAVPRRHRSARAVGARAERGGGGGFTAGFLLGGAVFGALGFLFAPQISAALLNDEARLKMPRFLDDGADGDGEGGLAGERGPPLTKEQLADRIAQLNAAIDDVSSALKAQDGAAVETSA